MLVDDESPGDAYAQGDPRHGKRAGVGVFRIQRDILSQSQIGLLYVGREFDEEYNRVGGLDGRIKLGEHWISRFQAIQSRTRQADGDDIDDDGDTDELIVLEDPTYEVVFDRDGRSFSSHIHYRDVGRDFRTATGFVPRLDIRDFHQGSGYTFWREGPKLISWKPDIFAQVIENHDGTRLDWTAGPNLDLTFRRQTQIEFRYNFGEERLLASEFSNLEEDTEFSTSLFQIECSTSFSAAFRGEIELERRQTINYRPAGDDPQSSADATSGEFELTLLPGNGHRIEAIYLYTRLDDDASGQEIFTDQILRTRWSWQINKMLSLRAILQYNDTDPNPALTSLERVQNINGDFLVTYLINPWTALYVGYNSNYQNLALLENEPENRGYLPRTEDDFLNDSHQFFFKVSYLFRL